MTAAQSAATSAGTADAVAGLAEQIRDLQRGGGADDRRGEQEARTCAASSLLSPTSRPPPIVTPEREMPGISASAWAAPTPTAWRQVTRVGDPVVVVGLALAALRGAAAQPLGAEQQQAVDEQEDRRRVGGGEHLAQRVLEQQAEDAGRNRPDDEQPAEPGVRIGDLTVAQRAAEAPEDPDPVLARRSPSSTIAVARWTATRKARKNLSFWWMFQPSSRGVTTAWPRLEIGNSSEKPWSRPRTMPWK